MSNQIIFEFIEAINSADVERLLELCSEDHVLTDSKDMKISGKENLKPAWTGYFTLFPDYKIEIGKIVEKKSFYCIIGYASAGYQEIPLQKNKTSWRIPVVWTAKVKNNRIVSWQIYADNSHLTNTGTSYQYKTNNF